jgi:hypothetical protein
MSLLDGLNQKELKAIATLRGDLSGHVSLMVVRHHQQCIAALVVAHSAEEAIGYINEQMDGSWSLGNTTTRSVQRNVKLDRGLFAWVPWKHVGGEHSAPTSIGLASRKRKKKKALARRQSDVNT